MYPKVPKYLLIFIKKLAWDPCTNTGGWCTKNNYSHTPVLRNDKVRGAYENICKIMWPGAKKKNIQSIHRQCFPIGQRNVR